MVDPFCIMVAGGEKHEVQDLVRMINASGQVYTYNFLAADILVVLDDCGSTPNRMATERPEVRIWRREHLVRFLNGDVEVLGYTLPVMRLHTEKPKPKQPDSYGDF